MPLRRLSSALLAATALLSGCPRPAPEGTSGGTGGSGGRTSDPAVETACTNTCGALTMGACHTACASVCSDTSCTSTRSVEDYLPVTSVVCSGQYVNFVADHTTYACTYPGADAAVTASCDDACTTLAPSDCTADCMSACLVCAGGHTAAAFQSATAVDCFFTNVNFVTPTTTIGCPR